MEIEYLLIGHGMDGKRHRDDFPKESLMVFEVNVRRAGDSPRGDSIQTFPVHRVAHNGHTYPVGIARSISATEIKQMIDESGIEPIPEELL